MVDAANAQLLPAPLVVAYEPHRAIGTAEPAPVDHLQEVCRFISRWLAAEPTAAGSRVTYGRNAGPELLSRLGDTVDRFVPGPASHNPAALASILDEVSATAEASK